MTRLVTRSVDRPIPEWRRAIEFLQHTNNANLSLAFRGIVELRADLDKFDLQRPRNDGHLNPLWAHATRTITTLSDGSEEVALDA